MRSLGFAGTEPRRVVLLIADIGGYTEYIRSHRMSLAHAEVCSARLLKKVIDAASGFDLIEIEGDAAFLSRTADSLDHDAAVAVTTHAAVVMHHAFHEERQHVVSNLCPCASCVQADNLKLKFVAHIGEVATQTINKRRKLVGIDVIRVHRMLKNPVQAAEYVLFSEELYRTGEAALPNTVHEISQDLEGIGTVRGYFVEIADLAASLPPGSLPPLPTPSLPGRLGRTLSVAGRGLPYMLGLRRTRQTSAY
ncbi:MAG: DUF2652 domain-containing protein [Solirubrobacterales bacterium]|nr:DUF2652 domain-containing protein [Solirubrobacterales bacterium]